MRFVLRQVWREMRNNRSFCLFYTINLALGLIGFVMVDTFREAIEKKVLTESRELLGADLAIRARRPLTEKEIELARNSLPENTKAVHTVDFFSMAAGPSGRSRLVKVVAIDSGFPFHGKFFLQKQGPLAGDELGDFHRKQLAWIYPEARAQLDAKLGEIIQLGDTNFEISDLIIEEKALTFQPTDLAPKVFISRNFIKETNLLGEGNLAFHTQLFQLPTGVDPSPFGKNLENSLNSPEIRVFTHQQAGHRAGRLLRYLSDFLSLVSLVALFLACLGSGFLFHGFLTYRMPELATMISLGARRSIAVRIFIFQLVLLGLFSTLPALLASSLFLPALNGAVSALSSSEVQASINANTVFLTAVVAIAAGWMLGLPALGKVRKLRPAELFLESARPGCRSVRTNILWIIPGLLSFWGLCLAQAHSEKLAHVFFGCFLGSLVLLFFLARFGFRLMENLFIHSHLPLRLATRSLARNRTGAITGFLALGLGVLLLTLIPQTHHGLGKEIGLDQSRGKLPSLFLFDLQEEQLSGVQELLEKEDTPLENITPWIRGKIRTIQGKPFEKTNYSEESLNNPDEQRRHAFRNRSFNLSYRESLLESEDLLVGSPFSGHYDPQIGKPAEISLEHKYADALGLKPGDSMSIEVAGLIIDAQVVNLRRVRWTSFQPNFFVQMQPGVLEQAPKTYLGTLHHLSSEKKERLQDLLVQKFPTISILDVERTGRKILEVVGKMTWALEVMASLSILAGLVVLFCVVREKARSQRWEINLQKVLGSSTRQLRLQIWTEFALLGGGAASIGVILSLITSYLLSVVVFDRVWSFRWDLPIGVVIVVIILSVITADLAARRILQEKPSRLLRED